MENDEVKVEEFDVLLEVDGYKRQLRVSIYSAFSSIERELDKLKKDVSLLQIGAAIPTPEGKINLYVLQRYCNKFETFVDVTDERQLRDGDRLTITCLSPSGSAGSTAVSLLPSFYI